MDYIVTNWQEIISLGIVATTFGLLIRAQLFRHKKRDCSTCALAEIQGRQQYRFKQ